MMKKKTSECLKLPKGVVPMSDTSDKKLIKDIEQFIDVGLISNTDAIAYSLALLYCSLDKKDKKILVGKICELSKMINEFFTNSIAEKEGSSIAFLYAMMYMNANMNATLMFDDHWKRLVEKGIECKQSFLKNVVVPTVANTVKKKVDENRGYC